MPIRPTLELEARLFASAPAPALLAGVDEVGRGSLAGPVSVGVAVLGPQHVAPDAAPIPVGLADSKMLRAGAREALVQPVAAWVSGAAVGHASAGEIDAIGIIAALRLAGQRALATLASRGLVPDLVLLDGTHDWLTPPAPELDLLGGVGGEPGAPSTIDATVAPVRTVRKGDASCASIAAASVLAKVERDALMTALDDPGYGFAGNKGYGSAGHLAALRSLGPGPQHRRSWKLPVREGGPGQGMMEP